MMTENEPMRQGVGRQLAIALVSAQEPADGQRVFTATMDEQESVQGRFDVAGACISTLVGLVKLLRDYAPEPEEVDRVLQQYAAFIAARPTE